MMVVLVLMTSCQVSEKLKKGPVISQAVTIRRAVKNAMLVPLNTVADCASLSKKFLLLFMQINEQFACHSS
jgi:hypothetical protein